MKQLIIILISVLGILYSSAQTAGTPPPQKTVPVKKEPKKELPPKGWRVPGHIMYCSISVENGVELPGVAKEEIDSFEVYDDAGFCLAIFSDESNFIEFFFENSEIIGEVRFLTTNYIYVGYL